jgi:hypothetical protein
MRNYSFNRNKFLLYLWTIVFQEMKFRNFCFEAQIFSLQYLYLNARRSMRSTAEFCKFNHLRIQIQCSIFLKYWTYFFGFEFQTLNIKSSFIDCSHIEFFFREISIQWRAFTNSIPNEAFIIFYRESQWMP